MAEAAYLFCVELLAPLGSGEEEEGGARQAGSDGLGEPTFLTNCEHEGLVDVGCCGEAEEDLGSVRIVR